MSEMPTYEELEQRVRELENAETERKQMAESLRSINEHLSFYRNAVDSLLITPCINSRCFSFLSTLYVYSSP